MQTIVQLTDIHLFEDVDKIHKGRMPSSQLLSAIDKINADIADAIVIVTGDLVSDVTPKAYQLLASLLQRIRLPVYVLPGNHDDPQMMQEYISTKNVFYASHIQFNNWLLIFLDSSSPGKNLGSGRLSQAELVRLTKLLDLHADQHILIFIHHPPILFGAKWFQSLCLENREELIELLGGYRNIRGVVFGHAHTAYQQVIDECVYSCAPSTWVQFDHQIHDHSAITSEPGGYNVYELSESGVIQVRSCYL